MIVQRKLAEFMESVAVTIPSLRIGYISIDKIITIIIKNFVSIDSILLFLLTLELNNKKVKSKHKRYIRYIRSKSIPNCYITFSIKGGYDRYKYFWS